MEVANRTIDGGPTGEVADQLRRLRGNIESVFLGKPRTVTEVLIGLLGQGHILIEDVPGVGKTVLARAIARSIQCSFARIQMTPDLLPSDILGVSVYNSKQGTFDFKRGPIFANVVLADEINRTTPRTQSALLEAMAECQVSMDGRSIPLEKPFLVIATQNPFEFEGTYYLPENQLDRFMLKVGVGYPDPDSELRILRERPGQQALDQLTHVMSADDIIVLQQTVADVRTDDVVLDYLLKIVTATREHEHIEVGVSPRGAQALLRAAQAEALLDGRDYVVPDDIKRMAVAVCAHRLVGRSFLSDGQIVSGKELIRQILDETPVPD
ncbi:MAG: MoxR family ATPase [Planctomycetes bacterium]|nr:MoxR family ATPase [Planctomycetota bacterium]